MRQIEGKNIVVWFSCGAASAVATKLTIDTYGEKNNIIVVNNPVIEEHIDNRRFKKDVEKWLNIEIIEAKSKQYPSASIIDVFDARKYMSGINGAPCTKELKKQARYEFESNNVVDFHVLGFTIDEWQRQKKFNTFERGNTIPILIQNLITKEDCFKILNKANIKLPEIYSLGFPNANCIGCVKATSPSYWNLVRKTFPDVFQQRLNQSRVIGCKLVRVKGKRIFLDQLKETDTGGKIKSHDCSIFCDLD